MIKVYTYNNSNINPELIIKMGKNIKLIFKYSTSKQYEAQINNLKKIKLPHYKIVLCNKTQEHIYKDIGECMELDYISAGRTAHDIANVINIQDHIGKKTNYFLLLNNICKFYISPSMVKEILNLLINN